MTLLAQSAPGQGPRKSILDLAPLELDCMNALWALGEATVRGIQEALADTRPRAYTTIMTIMDRLAHKGVVERRKSGRAYLYRARQSAEEARANALERVVHGFFGGSAEALAAQLAGGSPPRKRGNGQRARQEASQPTPALPRPAKTVEPASPQAGSSGGRLDESLL